MLLVHFCDGSLFLGSGFSVSGALDMDFMSQDNYPLTGFALTFTMTAHTQQCDCIATQVSPPTWTQAAINDGGRVYSVTDY